MVLFTPILAFTPLIRCRTWFTPSAVHTRLFTPPSGGAGECAAGEALFLRHYTPDIMMLTLGKPLDMPEPTLRKLYEAQVTILQRDVTEWEFSEGRVTARSRGAAAMQFAAVYSALGNDPRNALARSLGLALSADGRIVTDVHQESSVPGVYAAGDVVTGLNQLAVAMAQGEIAATRVHTLLRVREGRCVTDPL